MVSQVENLEKKSKVDGQIKQIKLYKKEEGIRNKTKKNYQKQVKLTS